MSGATATTAATAAVQPTDRAGLLRVLRRDPVRNACAIRLLEDAPDAADLHACGDSAFFRLPDPDGSAFVVLSAASADEGAGLAALSGGRDSAFFTTEPVADGPDADEEPDGVLRLLLGSHRTDWRNPCRQMSLPPDVELPPADPAVVPLDPGMAEYIHAHYQMRHLIPVEHLAERIRRGPSAGLFRDGKLVGWTLTHDEGTLGALEVLPEYRRQGIAERLSVAMCRKVREAGGIPTLHILRTNRPSLALAVKLGFVHTADVVWAGWDGAASGEP